MKYYECVIGTGTQFIHVHSLHDINNILIMMKYLLLFLLFALALSKYSYSDECYRYGKKDVSYCLNLYAY